MNTPICTIHTQNPCTSKWKYKKWTVHNESYIKQWLFYIYLNIYWIQCTSDGIRYWYMANINIHMNDKVIIFTGTCQLTPFYVIESSLQFTPIKCIIIKTIQYLLQSQPISQKDWLLFPSEELPSLLLQLGLSRSEEINIAILEEW